MGDLYRPTPVDRFLCSSFAKYLEQTGMAYDEELTRGELMDLQRVLDYVPGDRINGFAPKRGFGVADRVLQLLRDLEFDFTQNGK